MRSRFAKAPSTAATDGCSASSDASVTKTSGSIATSGGPDARLSGASFSLSVGNLDHSQRQSQNADGRIVRGTKTDDGLEDEMRRHAHDGRGRLQRIDVDARPLSFADEDFVADVVYRIFWEDGLCQPTYRVELPPHFDHQTTLQASPDGTTLGCAP